ncbi:hypothetical protein HAP48_0034875 [Bradyrhizobium septentrionale]|uniref:Uncharacterized protein n=1 Tax=Bradyrhizobium septentrionale TaxID=1404411 RepID=A0A974A254_9BRAD|nr:hypothetical protein [Bradyrhizobium septentrionale]UGY13718.1 hypothetical protein HAP48_0034875 [Bradyrhizobium septentrionale]
MIEYPTTCPHCGYHTDGLEVLGDINAADPFPCDGELSLCDDCGEWNVMAKGHHGGLRKPRARELRAIKRSENCARAIMDWRERKIEQHFKGHA